MTGAADPLDDAPPLPDAYIALDERAVVCYASPEVPRLIGAAPGSLVGGPLAQHLPAAAASRLAAALARAEAGDDPVRFAVPLPAGRARVRVYRNPTGYSLYFGGGLRESSRALRAERDRLARVLEVLPEAIIIRAAGGRLISSNAAARRILGRRPPARFVEPRALDVYHPDGAFWPLFERPMARTLRGATVHGEQMLVRQTGTDRLVPVLMSSAPLTDYAGRIVGAVAILQDISALKDLERQKDEFLSSAAHDLKGPITAIRGYAQLLLRRARAARSPETQRLTEGLTQIDAATRKMVALLDELLDVTRLEMGRPLELHREPTDLAALARSVAAEYAQTTGSHRIVLDTAEAPLVGEWDPQRLERVLGNLLGNAIKYSPQGGEITVTIERVSADGREWARLVVRDHGIGIPDADLPHVFERFQRAGNVGPIAGTGVGLAASRQIAEQHGGRLEVQSEEGRGSTFAAWLPLDSAGAGP